MRIILTCLAVAITVAGVSAQRPVPSHQAPSAGPVEVVRVNGVALLSDRLDNAVNTLLPQQTFHRSVSAARLNELRAKALETIVDEELEYEAGVRAGIRPTTAQVDAAVSAVRRRFASPQAFDAALRKAGATMAGARRELARGLTIEQAVAKYVSARCTVSAADARRFFDQNHDRFVVPEQLHVYAITVGVEPSASSKEWTDAKAKADDMLKRVRAGAAFEPLAKDMGFVHRGSLNDQFEAAAQTLAVGQTSDVIQTLYGYHIIRITEIRPPHAKTFAEVEKTLPAELAATRCAELKAAWIADLRRTAKIVVVQAR